MVSCSDEEEKETKDSLLKGSMNGTVHKIRVINSNSFEIGDTRGFTPYIRNGIAKNVKTPITVSFKSLENMWMSTSFDDVPFDENLLIHDFEKIDNPRVLFIAFKILDVY